MRELHDPYAFAPALSGHDLYLFNEGRLRQAWRMLGSHAQERDGVAGVRFAVWAPNAERVSVVGDFNRWDGRVHPMAAHGSSGVWELFIPGLRGRRAVQVRDPQPRQRRDAGQDRSVRAPVRASPRHGRARWCRQPSTRWGDERMDGARGRWDWLHAPMSIYEVHLGSWKRHPDGRFYSYRELAEHLVAYVRDMGYTHVELLPVSEHPLDESWGYQTTGYFAATTRFGSPDDLRALDRRLPPGRHRRVPGLGAGAFPARTPGRWRASTAPRCTSTRTRGSGLHQDWGTHIFNYGRNEVRSFLLSSAHYWLAEFHVDGLRVDAVASMLYLDYSRKAGRMAAQPLRRAREPGSHRVPARAQRHGARGVSRAR